MQGKEKKQKLKQAEEEGFEFKGLKPKEKARNSS